MIREKRKRKRRATQYHLKVYTMPTRKLAGRLVNIHRDGMMLVSNRPTKVGRRYEMKLPLPEPINGRRAISFKADSVWCDQDVNPAYYDTGFKIVDITPVDAATIEHSFESYLFPDWRVSF